MSTYCQHLSERQQKGLLVVLKFQERFDGTLGNLNSEPENFQFKPGMSSYHEKAFPIQQVHEAIL